MGVDFLDAVTVAQWTFNCTVWGRLLDTTVVGVVETG